MAHRTIMDDAINNFSFPYIFWISKHITDIYITKTDTTELENLSHNIIDIFIIET